MSNHQSDQEPPPEPSFRKRFSPNHELPLSTASSIVLHMVFVLLVALFGVTVLSERRELPIISVVKGPGGSGGDQDGNTDHPLDPSKLKERAHLEENQVGVSEGIPPGPLPGLKPLFPAKGEPGKNLAEK